jgi:cell division septum initiation protein DivIVA
MTSEDLRLQVQRPPTLVLNYEDRVGALKSELQKTKLLATSKTNEVILLQTESRKLQEKLELGSQAFTSQITSLQDNVRELSNKNSEFVKSNTSTKQKLSSKTIECEQLSKDVGDLKQNLKQLNLITQQRELDASQTIKNLSLQGEELAFKLQSMATQYETLQQQVKVRCIFASSAHTFHESLVPLTA